MVERDASRGLVRLNEESFDGLYVLTDHSSQVVQVSQLLQNQRILEGMPDGVVLLDQDNLIIWSNPQFRKWANTPNVVGSNFFSSLGNPEILGPDFCPFHLAVATGTASTSTLRVGDYTYYEIHAAPIGPIDESSSHLIVTVRDITKEKLQQQKLAAIHKAGLELANLRPEEVVQMGVDDRIELLKSDILHYTRDLLKFDVIEIRLLDHETQELRPLLSVGLDDLSSSRLLFARTRDNGVTGFVAATGKSYMCEDTSEDRLYLEGLKGEKSSLTVPLIWNDEVIGSFNVESPDTRAFSESDLLFLEIFSRDVAVALNTLELLVAQKANATHESIEAIHRVCGIAG